MSDPNPPISMLLGRQNRHSRELMDFREMMRAARADRRLDEREGRPGPASPAGSA
jgi:hypothetical protein